MHKLNGFTLIEASIVLIIVGLIAAAVISSTDAIKSSKLRNIIAEAEKFKVAYNSFEERFKYAPGDYPYGGKYWGNDCEGSSTGSDLCSGEGDFKIEHNADDALTGTAETLLAWKHIEKAELLEINVTGLKGSGANCSGDDSCSIAWQNVPGSNWAEKTGWYLLSGNVETAFFLGNESANSWTSGSSILPKDSRSIDVKVDDGNPVEGDFRASMIQGANIINMNTCLDGDTSYPLDGTTDYNLDNTSLDCGAVFVVDGS